MPQRYRIWIPRHSMRRRVLEWQCSCNKRYCVIVKPSGNDEGDLARQGLAYFWTVRVFTTLRSGRVIHE